MFQFGKKEYDENEYLIREIKNEVVRNRVAYNLNWFIKNAVKIKFLFNILTIITIIAPISSGIILNFFDYSFIFRFVSNVILGISSISASFIATFDLKKKWELYRVQAEKIKHILSEDIIYGDRDDKDILERIEKSIRNTDEQWVNSLRKK